MKIFIQKTIFFSLFTILSLILYIFVWGVTVPQEFKPNLDYRLGSPGFTYSRIREIKSYGKVDILVVGSSHAYRGFDPRIFASHNLKMFNLGSSSQSPIETDMLVKKYIDYLNPKIVIYEVYPDVFRNDGVESSIDLVTNDKIDSNTLEMVFKINHLKTYITFIYSFIRQLFSLDKEFTESKRIGKDTYINGGYDQRDLEYYIHKIHYPHKITYKIRKDQEKAFKNTLALLKKKGITVVLVQAPLPKSLLNVITNNDEMDSYYNSYGLKYYNFNKIINLNSTYDFIDDHLNQNGVQKFNTKLIEILKKDVLNQ